MSTTQTSPAPGAKRIEIEKTVFDLDSKGDVTVAKIGEFQPVANMEEFVSRLGNDAKRILAIVNDGLEKWTEKQIEEDTSIPWQLVEEDDEDNKTLVPFSGTLLSAERSKMLNASKINFAKLMFGYSKKMSEDKIENAKLKKAAKDSALGVILGNPAAVEALRK